MKMSKKNWLLVKLNISDMQFQASQRNTPFLVKIHYFSHFYSFFGSLFRRDFESSSKISDFAYFSLAIFWKLLFFQWFQKSILPLFCHIDHVSIGLPLWIPKIGDTKSRPHPQKRLKKNMPFRICDLEVLFLDHFLGVSCPQTSIISCSKMRFEIILMIKNEKMRFFSSICTSLCIFFCFFSSKYRE